LEKHVTCIFRVEGISRKKATTKLSILLTLNMEVNMFLQNVG
jgi:hypothetical protein